MRRANTVRSTSSYGFCGRGANARFRRGLLPGRTVRTWNWERNETERAVCKVLEEIAAEVGAKSIQSGMFARTP